MALDVFRGLTVALMVIVNSPGNQTAYPWLEHSLWHGCTLADLVFPFFILVAGTSAVFSLSYAQSRGLTVRQLLPKIMQRAAMLFLIGLLLNAFPRFDWSHLRVYGVLQRIALCYFAASLLYLTCTVRAQAFIAAALLLGYWLLLCFIPVPDQGFISLSLKGNWVGYVDRVLLAPAHLYSGLFDPEGLLSTLPAIATALIGNLLGVGLLGESRPAQKTFLILLSGLGLMLVGGGWGLLFPINKALWTSSYVLWTGGVALLLFSGCYWLMDVKGLKSWGQPLRVLGTQALAVYVLHVLFLKLQAMVKWTLADGTVVSAKLMITRTLFGWAKAENASLLYALFYCALWWAVAFMRQKNRASGGVVRMTPGAP
ncbi:DUF5009 domain-containing protein [Legionella taurinensis]|uniref:DUF5009 domain-containing protein n=2 Tax=Legionella taurinensis TaxID=70611 RepID=A0A3A5LJ49_9GAMM|nr:DUF5009 domain-containing protein [Legionella taurinensis]PUT40217.1 DUF5009 domain-containing protein [Legionella taurinensis]PUT42524.1 DUF5009 domain-containing protein [Legionella taurinensis]PUT45943.1 DUF5009 domain-containing protein [Legionella taurinensis]RJT46610.1 DUF5009 domain-containing protein [Legionella taurinensis]